MEIVNFLAQLWGFSLVIVGFAFLIRPQYIISIVQFMENEVHIILSGIPTVVLGVASLLNYHAWNNNWTVIITILGWALLIKGIIRLLFPAFVVKMLVTWQSKQSWAPGMFLCMVFFGCILVYLGFNG